MCSAPRGQIEGWGEEESYFVVSDASRIRVEALLLFHEGQLLEEGSSTASTSKNSLKTKKLKGILKKPRGNNGKGRDSGGGGAARRVVPHGGGDNTRPHGMDRVAVAVFHPCVVLLAALGFLFVTFS